MHRGKKHHEDLKNLLATLDIGSHINAGAQPLPKAGAQRTLEAVACKLLLGDLRDRTRRLGTRLPRIRDHGPGLVPTAQKARNEV